MQPFRKDYGSRNGHDQQQDIKVRAKNGWIAEVGRRHIPRFLRDESASLSGREPPVRRLRTLAYCAAGYELVRRRELNSLVQCPVKRAIHGVHTVDPLDFVL